MRVSIPGMSTDPFREDPGPTFQRFKSIPVLTTLMVVRGQSRGLCGSLLIAKYPGRVWGDKCHVNTEIMTGYSAWEGHST